METFNLLYGFSSEQTTDKISKAFRTLGYKTNIIMRPSKILIKDCLIKNLSLDAVILKEFLDGGDELTVQDLVEFADETTANFVVLLSSKYRGTDDMKKLYNAGFLNIYFLDGKIGADPLKVAELATRGRLRREARAYYKIDDELLDRSILTAREYAENYKYLLNKQAGANIVDRFITISRWLTGAQMAKFISMLPDNVLDVLRKYDEYYLVQTKLFRGRYMSYKEKKPKDAKAALSDSYLVSLLNQDREGNPVERISIPQPKAVKTSSAIYNMAETVQTPMNDYDEERGHSTDNRDYWQGKRREELFGVGDDDFDTTFDRGKDTHQVSKTFEMPAFPVSHRGLDNNEPVVNSELIKESMPIEKRTDLEAVYSTGLSKEHDNFEDSMGYRNEEDTNISISGPDIQQEAVRVDSPISSSLDKTSDDENSFKGMSAEEIISMLT